MKLEDALTNAVRQVGDAPIVMIIVTFIELKKWRIYTIFDISKRNPIYEILKKRIA